MFSPREQNSFNYLFFIYSIILISELKISDMDEWMDSSDDDSSENEEGEKNEEEKDDKDKKKKGKKGEIFK